MVVGDHARQLFVGRTIAAAASLAERVASRTASMNASRTIASNCVPLPLAHERERVVVREPRPVRPVARQGVVDVDDGDDATLERNLAAGEPARIAGAVDPLVVRPRDRRGEVEEVETPSR